MGSELVNKLVSEGWVERFTASGERLNEAIENYRELGFQVKTVPIKEINSDGCTTCFDDPADQTMMIFTKMK